MFPDPAEPGNELLPSLDTAVTEMYHNGLGLPDNLILNVKRFYSYLQQQAIDSALKAEEIAINKAQTNIASANKSDPKLSTLRKNLQTAQQTFNTKRT